MTLLMPTEEEVRAWLLHVAQHASHVEYYLHSCDKGNGDPERPHDLVGDHNKLEWEVLQGMALQYRSQDKAFFMQQVLPSINLHRRGQYHHEIWNGHFSEAPHDDQLVPAIDALCSLMEKRGYQPCVENPETAFVMATRRTRKEGTTFRDPLLREARDLMMAVSRPDITRITSLEDMPNIGIPREVYDRILECFAEAREMLKGHGYHV